MKTNRSTHSPPVPSSAGRVQISSASTQAAPAQEPQSKPSTAPAAPAAEGSHYETTAPKSGPPAPSKASSPEERSALNTRTSSLGYGKSASSAPPAAKSPEEVANAVLRGAMTRRQVRVSSEAPGIIHTRIRKGNQDAETPLGRIQNEMQHGAVYDKLKVVGGAAQGDVVGTSVGEGAAHPPTLAEKAPPTSAVINGGFFVHMEGVIKDAQGETLMKTGVPVGPTSTRSDHTPINDTWKDVYGYVKINDKIGLSAGPLLAHEGKLQKEGLEGERFTYRMDGVENPLNNYAGALTHANENNERSAISVAGDDVVMHTLTAKGVRNNGVTMKQWQNITAQQPGNPSTLNLDGGGSVFSGVRTEEGVKQLSRGGRPEKELRPVANIITAQPQEPSSSKKPAS